MGRPLPPELVAEIHKCLPLPNAINVLVNVSKTFVINNRRRMLRNVQQLRASLNEYIHTFETIEDEEGENDPGSLVSNDNVEWTPQLDALLRYGTWLTSARELMSNIVGRIPENFVEELLLHMAHSSSTQMMLHVEMNFAAPPLPMPTFLKQLFDKKRYIQIGTQGLLHRTILESIQLETDNGKILHIFDGELHLEVNGEYELTLIVENKMDRKNWFQIKIFADHSKEFIRQLEYSHWEMQPYHENGQFEFNWLKHYLAHYQMEENGNKLEAKQNIYNDTKFELFLRRGVYFSQFRHFKILKPHHQGILLDYQGLVLISYVCHTKHPEEFLESIDINSERSPYSKFAFDQILEICRNGIPKGEEVINVGTQKLHFLSAKTVKPESGDPTITELQFTLANIPTNGEYVFDVNLQLESGHKLGDNGYVRLRIQKRKVNGRTALIKMILTGIGIASILFLTPRFAYF